VESPKDLKAVAKALAELLRRYESHITEKGYGAHLGRHAAEHKDVAGTLDRIPTGVGGSAPSTSSYVTISAEAGLSSERRVAAGNGIGLTDAGANSTLTIALSIAGQVIGDIIYHTGVVWDRLVGNTTVTKKFLTQTGDGAASTAPGWDTIADGDVPATHSGSAHHARQHGLGTAADHTGITDYSTQLGLSSLEVGDTDFELAMNGGNPNLFFDTTDADMLWYERNSDTFNFYIANTPAASVKATGLYVDHILEVTGDHGVNIDSVLVKDGLVDGVDVSGIHSTHDAANVTYTPAVATDWDGDADPGNLDDAVDQLAERIDDTEALGHACSHDHSAAGDGTALKPVTVDASTSISTDHIYEHTLNNGVTVDGLLIKDGGIPGDLAIGVNDTAETVLLIYGADAGHFAGGRIELFPSADYDAVIDNWNVMPWEDDFWIERNGVGNPDICIKNDGHVEIQNGALEVDHIKEYGAAHGVDIDGVLCKDDAVETDAIRGLRETSGPTSLTVGTITDGEFLKRVGATIVSAAAAGGGAPTDADYLVGTANAGLSAEIVVGATPGGELGGTWASPTVDATHSGSAHSAYVANSLYDAQSILAATADNTPAAVTVAEQRVVGRLTGGNIDDITIGIADDNILQVDQASTADDNDYAKFTANGIEGRSYAEVISDLGLKTVATDTIWAAAGDLAVGTGNDTAGVLTKGTDAQVLTMVAGAVAWAAAAGGLDIQTIWAYGD